MGGAGNTTISSAIATGTGSLTLSGSGRLVLTGNNSLTGGINLNSGILQASTNANALGGSGNALTWRAACCSSRAPRPLLGATTRPSPATPSSSSTAAPTAGAGVTSTMGTLSMGSQTLDVLGGGATTSGIAGLTFGPTTLTGNPTFYVQNRTNGGNVLLTLGAVTANGSGNANILKIGAGNLTVSGPITTGTGSFTQYTAGTTTFSGSYSGTGSFKIYGGSVLLTGSATTLAPTDVELLGGNLTLGQAGDSNIAWLNSGSTLTMGGGQLNSGANGGGTVTQTIAALVLQPGVSAIGVTNPGAGPLTLSIAGSITRPVVGGILNFDNNANFPVSFVNQPALSGGTSAAAGGILGGWATYNGDFASTTGTGNIVTSVSYDSNNSILNPSGTNSTISQAIGTGVMLTSSVNVNALKLTAGTTTTYALNLNSQTLNIATGGLIDNSTGSNYPLAVTSGTLTAGSAAGAELFLINENGTGQTVMGATITNNSGGTGTVNLVRGGDNKNSPLYLSGDNTYTGTTVLSIRNDLAASTVNGTNSVTYLLTERQFGAMPAPGSVVSNAVTLNNAAISFVPNINPSWAPERGITLGGGAAFVSSGNLAYSTNLSAPITGTGPLTFAVTNGSEWMLSNNGNTFDGTVTCGLTGGALLITEHRQHRPAQRPGRPSNAADGLITQQANGGVLQYVGITAASSNRDFQAITAQNGQIAASGRAF